MKKSLLTIFGAFAVGAVMAQTPSPSWTISQNSNFPIPTAGTRFLDAVSPNVVWGIGYDGTAPSSNYNYFTRTINGGTTFNGGVVFTSTANPSVGDTNTWVLANLDAIDANTAWVSAYKKSTQTQGAVFRTTNGGVNWLNMNAPGMYTNTAAFTNIVAFVTPSVGITMGDPNGTGNEFEIWRTIDGGNSWTKIPGASIPNPLAGEFGLVNVYCKQGSSNIWFGTNEGRIYYSNDAGLTWNVSAAGPAGASVNDIAFTDPNNGVAYVYNGTTFEMYNTTNGGQTWAQITVVSPNVGKNDLNVVPNTNYFVSAGAGTGNQILSYSTDNGVNWTDWGSVGIQYLTIDFADGNSGWAGSFSTTTASIGGMWKYSDVTLTSPTPPTSNFSLPANLCLNGSSATVTPVNSSTGTGPLTYSFSSSPNNVAFATSTSSAPVITFTANGTYTITLAVTNSISSNSSSQIINVLTCTSPSVSFSSPTGTLCNKVAINFTNTTTGNPTPTYSWSTSPAANVTISPNSTSTNASITFSAPGIYSVTLVATNANGTSSLTQTVNIANCSPTANFLLGTLTCTNSAITMTNTSFGGATSYSWSASPSVGSISPNAAAISPTITFVNAGTYTITLKATNGSGTSIATKTIVVSTCVGINENSIFANNVHVFPNPAKEMLNIEVSSSDNYSVVLTNLIGKVILTDKSSKDKMNINLSSIAPGVYFLTIDSKGQKTTKKIIVE